MGSDKARQRWLEEKVETWVAGLKLLAVFSIAFPQKAYSVLTMLLQNEWQYVQRVTPSVGPVFEPL